VIHPAPSVRRAQARDLDALAELFGELLAHHAAIEPAFRVRADARERIPRLLARQLGDPDAAIFVGEEPRGLVGFCSVRVERAEAALVESARAEIADLAVRAERRRSGVGRALVEAARAWVRSRGAERLEVRVAVRNPEGQAFWRALGFEGFVDVLHHRL
jgi:ribosomal protein S18 acetylase RimI-like enzyme